jgi:hypothetical protein
VIAAARGARRVLFAVQPFADPSMRQLHSDERDLISPLGVGASGWWGSTLEFIGDQWRSYIEMLRAGCEEIGVPFGVLEPSEFEGWAFVDRVHMTDAGQQQAARKLLEMMANGSA